jgi:hypothetical protein
VALDVLGRPGRDDLAAGVAAFRAEVDQPVAGADDVEVVLDDDDRVPASSRRRNERISLAMSSKCRPVVGSSNMKSVPLRAEPGATPTALRRLGEEAGELEALRLAARERRHRLAELDVLEADVDDRLQQAHHLAVVAKELHRLGDGEVEDVGDRELAIDFAGHASVDLDVEDLGAETRPSQSGQRR